MLEPQLTKQVINDARERLVHDIFCPEATRSCSPVEGKRVYELCYAAGITTIGQLVDMKDDQLRAKSFSEDDIRHVNSKLKAIKSGVGFLPSAFITVAAKDISAGLTPEQAQLYIEHNGAGHVGRYLGQGFNLDKK